MAKALHFNPIRVSEQEFTEITTEFKVVDEFYYKTNKGMLIMGEVWKDTPKNRETINLIIQVKKDAIKAEREYERKMWQLFNEREK